MIGKHLTVMCSRSIPILRTCQVLSVIPESPKIITYKTNVRTICKNTLIDFQRGYSFSSSKSVELTKLKAKMMELETKKNEINDKLVEANTQKLNTLRKIKEESGKVAQLKSQIQLSPASPERVKELQQREGELNSLKSKLEQTERILNELEKQQQQIILREEMLISIEAKQNQKQEQSFWTWLVKMIKGIASVGGLLGFIIQIYQTYYGDWQIFDTTTGRQQRALREFNTNKFDQELSVYISGSPMQTEIKKLIKNYKRELQKKEKEKEKERWNQKFDKNFVLLIAGCPGAGKSTSIKYLIQEYRKDGNDIYYINLKSNGQIAGGRTKDLKNLLNGISKKYNKETTPKRSVMLVVDDVNMLEKLNSQTEEYNNLFDIYTSSDLQFLEIICVSSSSRFTKKIMKNNYYSVMKKVGRFVILQDLESSKYQQFIQKLINSQFGENVSQQTKKLISSRKYSARDIDQIRQQFKAVERKTDEELLKLMKIKDQRESKDVINLCEKVLTKEVLPQLEQFFVKQIIDTKGDLDVQTCQNIKDNIKKKYGLFNKFINFEEVIDQFQDNNFLIFCRPRTQVHRNGFQIALDQSISRAKLKAQKNKK